MADKTPTPRIAWTAQVNRHAHILAGLGLPHVEIAAVLGCVPQTVRKHLGRQETFNPPTFAELLDLFERYDAERNLAEALTARSGSVEQARLRASLRAHRATMQPPRTSRIDPNDEDLSDDQVCAELERLVGRPFRIVD